MEHIQPIGTRLARAVYHAARDVAHASVASRPVMSVARLCGVRKATVFMLHRFTDGRGEVHGTDVTMLRSVLGKLRRQGISFMRLRDLASHVASGTELPGPTAVFTVDDGYSDFAQLAAPIFAGFDCSPTVFLVTDFISGRQWCWWDRVTESFLRSPLQEALFSCAGRHFRYALGSEAERRANAMRLTEILKRAPDAERRRVVAAIDGWLGTVLPEVPPAEYGALTWDEIRGLERSGVDFAPHTMTHPILSQTDPDLARSEILDSWATLRRECHDPSPIFSYPNGSIESFGPRDVAIVRESGMAGAVAFRRRYVDPRVCTADDRFNLSRFSLPNNSAAASFVASGLSWDQD